MPLRRKAARRNNDLYLSSSQREAIRSRTILVAATNARAGMSGVRFPQLRFGSEKAGNDRTCYPAETLGVLETRNSRISQSERRDHGHNGASSASRNHRTPGQAPNPISTPPLRTSGRDDAGRCWYRGRTIPEPQGQARRSLAVQVCHPD